MTLSRWLVLVVALAACSRGAGIGELCENPDECAGGLSCGIKSVKGAGYDDSSSDLRHTCVQACSTDDDCGNKHMYCPRLGVCMRQCRQDSDCTAFSYCHDHHYCAAD
jgi:hypothetical protein